MLRPSKGGAQRGRGAQSGGEGAVLEEGTPDPSPKLQQVSRRRGGNEGSSRWTREHERQSDSEDGPVPRGPACSQDSRCRPETVQKGSRGRCQIVQGWHFIGKVLPYANKSRSSSVASPVEGPLPPRALGPASEKDTEKRNHNRSVKQVDVHDLDMAQTTCEARTSNISTWQSGKRSSGSLSHHVSGSLRKDDGRMTGVWAGQGVRQGCPKTESSLRNKLRGFPGVPVVKNLPCNARDTGSIPDPGRCHMPRSN